MNWLSAVGLDGASWVLTPAKSWAFPIYLLSFWVWGGAVRSTQYFELVIRINISSFRRPGCHPEVQGPTGFLALVSGEGEAGRTGGSSGCLSLCGSAVKPLQSDGALGIPAHYIKSEAALMLGWCALL